ncbi:SixA phosphatase family protein [Formosa haliotis]|uniref:SixA phosphatase family protein n=1 Tax=Formosa haliotis TaxID=1555194 RepID=UPI000825FBA4|nr:histidine phosphatase family protein [Formosa haliotis]
MKKLILIRHGKSSWKYDVEDMYRPLKSVGEANTIKVCKTFLEMSEISLKNVFSSPSKRTRDTCEIFIKNYSNPDKIEPQIIQNLYDFEGRKLVQFIKSLDNDLDTVFIFGHNNALTNFVNAYGDFYIENVPTSGLVVLEFLIDNWSDLSKGSIKLKLFPKELI